MYCIVIAYRYFLSFYPSKSALGLVRAEIHGNELVFVLEYLESQCGELSALCKDKDTRILISCLAHISPCFPSRLGMAFGMVLIIFSAGPELERRLRLLLLRVESSSIL